MEPLIMVKRVKICHGFKNKLIGQSSKKTQSNPKCLNWFPVRQCYTTCVAQSEGLDAASE